MTGFEHRDGRLRCDEVDVGQVAREVGTPLYLYSARAIRERFDALRSAFAALDPLICYSIKANSNLAVLDLLRGLGSGFDVVSEGEIHRARTIAADPRTLVFAGVGKTDSEIAAALDAKVGWFNVESAAELENIDRLARARDAKPRVLLRVNPDVDAKTHRHITTGRKENKFGIDLATARDLLRSARVFPAVTIDGFHCHIGSQITDIKPYVEALSVLRRFVERLREEGHAIGVLNLGGGFGIEYEKPGLSLRDVAAALRPDLEALRVKLLLEPGRAIVGEAGILVTQVQYVKQGLERRFVICDAGMNDLLRPSLYSAWHRIEPVIATEGPRVACDVVGPICESADFLARERPLQEVARGDLLAVFQAGAYGFSMASNYNSRCRAAEVMVDGAAWRVVRERETFEDLVRGERR